MTDRQDSDAPPSKGPVRLWLESVAKCTASPQMSALKNMARFLWPDSPIDYRDQPWWEVTYEQSVTLRSHLARTYSPQTARRYMNGLRAVWKESWRLGRLSHENYVILSQYRPMRFDSKPAGRALSRAQAELLISAEMPLRDKALIATMLAGGLRRNEVCLLASDHVKSNEDGSVTLLVHGKGKKDRMVTIGGRSGVFISSWRKKSRSGSFFRLGHAQIGAVVKQTCERLGLGNVTPHDLRRTCITLALDATSDLLSVQRLAGHSSPRTTAIYDRRGEAAALKLANSLGL